MIFFFFGYKKNDMSNNSPFEMARVLAQTKAARVDQRAVREQLAKVLTEQNRLGVQVRAGERRMARVTLSPTSTRPNKRQRIDRLTRQLQAHADEITDNRDNIARMRTIATHIMRNVDHREFNGKNNVTVQIVDLECSPQQQQREVVDVKPEPVDA